MAMNEYEWVLTSNIQREMGKIIENYSLQQQLGRGVYSTVFKAINTITKQEVAIKMVKSDKFKQFPKLEEGTYNQINILANLEHCPHIIRYYDMLKTVNNFYFVYEYCNGGTLQSLLLKQERFSERVALNYFFQIVSAFKVLNKHNIMHRDLKPENLLIHEGVLKLADFGFCKPLENQYETTATMLGSPIYMAPEILKGETYTIKADIWSLGVVLFRMLYGFCPFESNNIGKLIKIIEEQDIRIPDKPQVSTETVHLLRRMITKNCRSRADWSEIFNFETKIAELSKPFLPGNQSLMTPPSFQLQNSSPHREKSANRIKESMKTSFTPSDSTANTVQKVGDDRSTGVGFPYSSHEFGKTGSNQQPSELIYTPNTSVRVSVGGKSPFRENLKKDQLLKDHQKCLQITSLALTIAAYERYECVALSCLFIKQVERELTLIVESLRKECDPQGGDEPIRSFIRTVEQELRELQKVLGVYREEIKSESLESLGTKKKQYLRKFVNGISRDRLEDLVAACRVVDYVQDELIIRKETFQTMSKEKLLSNIRIKMEAK